MGAGQGRAWLPLFLHLFQVSASHRLFCCFPVSLASIFRLWVSSSLSLFLCHCLSSIIVCISYSSKCFQHFVLSISLWVSIPRWKFSTKSKAARQTKPTLTLTPLAHTGRKGVTGEVWKLAPEVGRPGRGSSRWWQGWDPIGMRVFLMDS